MTENAIRDPRKLAERLIETGEEWSDLHSAAAALEETKEILYAQIQAEHFDKPEWKAKALAKADPRFKEHVEMMIFTRRDANKARVRYDAGKAYVELARSAESTRRAEMGMR